MTEQDQLLDLNLIFFAVRKAATEAAAQYARQNPDWREKQQAEAQAYWDRVQQNPAEYYPNIDWEDVRRNPAAYLPDASY